MTPHTPETTPATAATPAPVHPLVSPWGRFGLYSYFVDAPEPAIIDTGIASSPAEGMKPALEALGRDISEVKWILLTHGHIDHLGGAAALHELTGGTATVVIHEADAHLLSSRRAHVDLYLDVRQQYLNNPDAEAEQTRATEAAISGELDNVMLIRGGDTINLGGGITVTAHHVPGHTPGSVAYVINGQNDVFTGDAVQIHGAANGFPGYEDPAEYRRSLEYLRDTVQPNRMFLGHPYRGADGVPFGVELDREQAVRALTESLDIEARAAAAAQASITAGLNQTDSPYSPFELAATTFGYTGNPTLEPSPFFTTMHGYLTRAQQELHEDPTDATRSPAKQ